MISFIKILHFIILSTHLSLFTSIKAEQSEYSLTIRDGNGIETQLKWKKTEQFLANKHLPIFGINLDQSISRNEEIMDELGDFETYYDLDESSAIVFLKKSKRFFGVVDNKYLIVDLPLKKMNQVHVIGRSRHVVNNANAVKRKEQLEMDSSTTQQEINLAGKRPSEEIFNPDLPSTSREKRPRIDEIDKSARDDNSSPGGILRKFLSDPPKPFANLNSDAGSRLKKMFALPHLPFNSRDSSTTQQNNPGSSKEPSDSNKLLKLLLSSPCTLPKAPKKKHLGTFYPEVLLFISNDIVKLFEDIRGVNGFSKDHVMYLIIYMNAVSMLFGKLKQHVNININIAGIVFENEENAFPFSGGKFINNQLVTPNGDLVLNSIVNYINNRKEGLFYREIFADDAFDFFLYLTTFDESPLEYDEQNYKQVNYHGIATESFDITDQRARLRYLGMRTKIHGAVVENSKTLESFVDAARELAHLMGTNGDYFHTETIMSSKDFALGYQRVDYLKWSQQSEKSFQKYFSENKNRCVLMNKPRSLNEFAVAQKTLWPIQQCDCYSFGTPTEEKFSLNPYRNNKVCMAPLPCIDSSISESSTSGHAILRQFLTSRPVPLPFDGTPCDVGKVCWQGDCVSTPMEIIVL